MCLFAGTIKVAESYKIGERTLDFMLEILNLGKKEVISIDGISNQEFSQVPIYTSSFLIFFLSFLRYGRFHLFKGSNAFHV